MPQDPSAAAAPYSTVERAVRSHPLLWGAVLCAIVLWLGWTFTVFVTAHGERQAKSDLKAVALTAASSFDPADVASLKGRPEDAGTPTFERVSSQLKRIHDANSGVRFVYLMGLKDGQLVFLADAEPASSPDHSAPGDVYDEETAGTLQVFATGQALIEDPYQDRWGQWVSGLAPIKHPASGKTLAVLGIDINAEGWLERVGRYRAFAVVIVGLITGVVATFAAGLYTQNRLNLRMAALNRDLAVELGERRRAEEELRLAAAVFENTAEGVMVTTANGTIQSVNPAFERITGFTEAEALRENPRILKSGEHDAAFFREMRATLDRTGKWHGVIWNRRKDGELYPQDTTINALKGPHGEVQHYAAVLSDITAQKQMENRLRELSFMDGLTGIPNRRLFDETLDKEWRRAQREGRPLSLLMADIDYFKKYNDRYGHLAGDLCLQRIANAINAAMRRAGDLPARYGGEEFAVILPGTDADKAAHLAEAIRGRVEGLGIPHEDSDVNPNVTISLGHATLVPSAGRAPQELIALADKALYEAKNGGRNRVVAASA